MPAQKPEKAFPKVTAPQPAAKPAATQPFYNSFTGPLFEPVTTDSAGRALSSINSLLNPFASAQRFAASAGGAMGTAARGLATGQIPLMGRASGDRGVAAAIPQFPSGAIGTGDAYPTTPQTAASAPTKFPYGHPLGPSIYSQAPTAATLTTGMYSPVPLGQSFAGINPAERSNYIPYGGGGTATMGLGGVDVNYPSRLGLMGGNIASGAISPLPVQTQQSLAAGLTPLAQSSMGIEGGPISLRGATAMTAPVTAAQQGRTAIQTPRGTIYATGAQQQALNARTTAYEGRTPAQQQALLAQMRERGAAIAANRAETMRTFAAERRANPQTYTTPLGASISAPTNMFGQPIRQFQQTYAQRDRGLQNRAMATANVLPFTGFGRMQQEQQKPIQFATGRSPLYAGMGIGAAAGGPQPSSPMLASNTADQRKRMFSTI